MNRLEWKMVEPPNFKVVPEKAGIYIISTKQETDKAFEVKYVGHADNLRVRASEHWSKKEKNEELKAHIAEDYIMKFNYSEIESRADREGMELYLYDMFEPPLNPGPPRGSTIVKCTIPAVRKYIS